MWWGWSYTTWMTNWLDPESVAGAAVLIMGMMLASLLMAVAIPDAFGDRAVLFAAGYVALQVMRNAVHRPRDAARPGHRGRRSSASLAWSLVTGALLPHRRVPADGRAGDPLGDRAGARLRRPRTPATGCRARRVGRPADWDIEAGHFAERFQLFIIIALGESIVVTGATASPTSTSTPRACGDRVAFVGTAALWWLYFDYVAADRGAAPAGRRATPAGWPGTRSATSTSRSWRGSSSRAVGDELVIAHPGEELSAAGLACVAGGPAIYLLGHVALRLRMAGSISRSAWGRRPPARRRSGGRAAPGLAVTAPWSPAVMIV